MTSKSNHDKHPPMVRPDKGYYHRCELGIYGTDCDRIEQFFHTINLELHKRYSITYVDADHRVEYPTASLQKGKKKFYNSDQTAHNEFDDKLDFVATDAVIVNGNHYPAVKQIVFLDGRKKDSLHRRIDQLSDVLMVIELGDQEEIYDFLDSKITTNTKVCSITDIDTIISVIEEEIIRCRPQLRALILGGGKSQRMGSDKSQIVYHNDLPQEVHLAELCEDLGLEVYHSKASNFPEIEIDGRLVIKDRMMDMGPFGAIISAFMHDPDCAWLVIACDIPLLTKEILEQLILQRDISTFATAIKASSEQFMEPLIAIYEPRAYRRFLEFMSLGYSCPRKVLINTSTTIVEIKDDDIVSNVNTYDEKEAMLCKIRESE